jgi:hypothetical protein
MRYYDNRKMLFGAQKNKGKKKFLVYGNLLCFWHNRYSDKDCSPLQTVASSGISQKQVMTPR